ncbi:hypothetical protein P8S55_08330 [Halomonas sp. M1]|uniref:hypothetical protein n=1 Tax=Halomonas sp. M1 TaxID=3035470 RepID=UPI0024868C7F|nr:hypothetical protein [Halomonas sp. M1]WFE73091.1 hypothetical protein P8S55_08330 [Halomonas sp. M1]
MTTTPHLKLRGLIEREGNVYVAHCLELGIAVQGDSVEDVKQRMDAAIGDYIARVVEIFQEGDKQGAKDLLLHRKAPLSVRAKYHWLRLKALFRKRSQRAVWEEDRPSPLAFS